MAYHPHTDADIAALLQSIGATSLEDLFATIPAHLRATAAPDLPPALSEQELYTHLAELAGANANPQDWMSFLGGGANRHYVPAAVAALASRQEFMTAYTPYQAELSQGTLQAIFEFQTLVSQLFGMDVANASLYDGASATAEAVLMAKRVSRGRDDILLAETVHPQYLDTVRTYTHHLAGAVETVPIDRTRGTVDRAALEKACSDSVAAVVLQQPTVLGTVDDLHSLIAAIHDAGALAIVTTSEPLAFGVLVPPGAQNADIVCGEGQSFGLPVTFGGPYLGLFATRDKFLRRMPGRLVGETVDSRGARAFCMTLVTREQHIRREKATSNICTNEGLCALMATIHMAMLGKAGMERLARINLSRAEYAKTRALHIQGVSAPFTAPTFNEFVLKLPAQASAVCAQLRAEKILPGIPLAHLGGAYAEMHDHLLVSVTEMNTRDHIDAWAAALEHAL